MRTRNLDRGSGSEKGFSLGQGTTVGEAEHTGRDANEREADPSHLGFSHQRYG